MWNSGIKLHSQKTKWRRILAVQWYLVFSGTKHANIAVCLYQHVPLFYWNALFNQPQCENLWRPSRHFDAAFPSDMGSAIGANRFQPTSRAMATHKSLHLGTDHGESLIPYKRWLLATKYIVSYNVGPPSDVCWFISPSNYSYKYHKP